MDATKLLAALDEKIIKEIDLGEFHERLAGEVLHVWVNPPMPKMRHLRDIKDNEKRGVEFAIIQLVDLEPDEVRTLFEKDAPFCDWLVDRMTDLTTEYREGQRKKSTTD